MKALLHIISVNEFNVIYVFDMDMNQSRDRHLFVSNFGAGLSRDLIP